MAKKKKTFNVTVFGGFHNCYTVFHVNNKYRYLFSDSGSLCREADFYAFITVALSLQQQMKYRKAVCGVSDCTCGGAGVDIVADAIIPSSRSLRKQERESAVSV